MAPDKTPLGSPAPLDRPGAMKRVAVIYAPISLLAFIVAVIDGGAGFIVLTGLNAPVGVVSRWQRGVLQTSTTEPHVNDSPEGSRVGLCIAPIGGTASMLNGPRSFAPRLHSSGYRDDLPECWAPRTAN
jgi:hypothetical protein